MAEIDQELCKKIYQFLTSKLTDEIDEHAFEQITMSDFGHYLFELVKRNISGATDDLINAVTLKFGCKAPKYEDHYLRLCHSLLRFEKVPRDVYMECQKKFYTIFKQGYEDTKAEAYARKSELDAAINANRHSVNLIVEASNSNRNIRKDLRECESRITELCWQCNELRTQKEMLETLMEYLDECFSNFCDFKDESAVQETIRKLTITSSKDGYFTIDEEFEYYEDILSSVKVSIDDIFRIAMEVKLHPFYDDFRMRYHAAGFLDEVGEEQAAHALKEEADSLPRVAVLKETRTGDVPSYRAMLDTLIRKYDLPGKLTAKISGSVSIGERKSLLLKAIDLYRDGEYDVFINIIPIQIEGLFADCLQEGTVFDRFTDLKLYPDANLRQKIINIKNLGLDVNPLFMMYFGIYFNNLVRNKVAHGIYAYNGDDNAAVFAMELLLDFNTLLHIFLRRSETEKMHRLIARYKESFFSDRSDPKHHFRYFFHDLIKRRFHHEYDSVERIRPMQFAYWMMNPYYEELYSRASDMATFRDLRADFVSNEFWLYVLDELNKITNMYIPPDIDHEFMSVVNAMFGCDLPEDTKKTLRAVSAALSRITGMR